MVEGGSLVFFHSPLKTLSLPLSLSLSLCGLQSAHCPGLPHLNCLHIGRFDKQAKWPGSSVSPTAQRKLNEPVVKSQSNQTVRPGTAPQLATYARGPVCSAVPRGNNERRRLMNTLNETYKNERHHVQMPKHPLVLRVYRRPKIGSSLSPCAVWRAGKGMMTQRCNSFIVVF